jgi:hypothetical protein
VADSFVDDPVGFRDPVEQDLLVIVDEGESSQACQTHASAAPGHAVAQSGHATAASARGGRVVIAQPAGDGWVRDQMARSDDASRSGSMRCGGSKWCRSGKTSSVKYTGRSKTASASRSRS